MRRIGMMLLGVLLWPGTGAAETIHRCRTTEGDIRYQQIPCSGSAKPAGERHYKPEPDSTPLHNERSPQSRRVALGPRAKQRKSRVSDAGDRAASCEETRLRRDAWERRVGLGRTYDDLRRWNDAVAWACK